MYRLLAIGALCVAFASCSRENDAETGPAPAKPAAEKAETAAKPEYGEWGVETAYISPNVRPGDDFYRHVNGGWLDTFRIPDEYSSYGPFTALAERSEERVRQIIEDAARVSPAAGGDSQKIGDFFSSFMDEETIDALGLSPLAEDFALIDSAATHEDVAQLLARADIAGKSPIAAYVDVDFRQPDRYVVYLTQSGLGMPNRDYYREERFADKRAKYQAYINTILSLLNIENSASAAEAVYSLESNMAEIHWSSDKRRERDLTYNPKSLNELEIFAPGFPWRTYLTSADIGGQEKYVVREDDAVARLAALFAETPVETWRIYLKFHLANAYAQVLPREFEAANFDFFGKELQGALTQKDRWKRGVAAVNGALGEAVGRIYVERYFSAEAKEQMDALVSNLRRALADRLAELEWMSEDTKARAFEKLALFNAKIGYPEKWRDYSDLEIVAGDAYGNAKRAALFEWKRRAARLDGPVDKSEWAMTPQRVNAYYSPQRNEIVFPAAILQAPFFDPAADAAVNYGAIGAVIGHEIGHGFDDQGRKSDGLGMLRDWWTSEDAATFEAIADALGAQFAAYEPVAGFPINPKLTMGENIGDLGGLAIAYHAYKMSLGNAEAPIIDGYTGDQRFFMAWAQIWRRVQREEQLKNQIAADPHSPAEYRVNGIVRNMDAWYAAFAITPEDKLYLPPEERVKIW